MSKEILKLLPEHLWANFYSLTQIPRPSKKEGKIIEFMKQFGENLGLETQVDKVGNVLIRKVATAGMKGRQTIILQAHLDMVPQKNSTIDHNFETDPIDAYIDGDWVTANNTTLGADNGMGVAAAMSILQSSDLVHGAIEALFTIDEETGMTGAFNLQPSFLKGDILLNLDSEDEGELYIGCAGGMDTTSTASFSYDDVPENFIAYKVSITGLKGGHSGLDIVLKRGNAVKILNRLLINANEHLGLLIFDFEGGNIRNAIPREAFATVLIPESEEATFKQYADEIAEIYINKIATDDPSLKITLEKTENPGKVMDVKSLDDFLNAVHQCPNGVIKMIDGMPDVPETSTNLSIVTAKEGKIEIATLQRSSTDAGKLDASNQIKSISEKYGFTVVQSGDYPGWDPNLKSPILKSMKEAYNTQFGKIPEVKVIHAGLECGILGSIYKNLDMISFGPTIRFPHSPDEKVNIPSVNKFWDYLTETLKNAPTK